MMHIWLQSIASLHSLYDTEDFWNGMLLCRSWGVSLTSQERGGALCACDLNECGVKLQPVCTKVWLSAR